MSGYAPTQTEPKELDKIQYTDKELAQMHSYIQEKGFDRKQYFADQGAIRIGDRGEEIVLITVTEYAGRHIKSCLPAKYEELGNKWEQYCFYLERKGFGTKKRLEAYAQMPEAQVEENPALAKIKKKS